MQGVREQLRESGSALARVMGNPDLRKVNLAFAGSIIGDWAFAVVVSLYAFRHGGPTAIGVLGTVRYIAMAALAPIMSVLGDRYSRRRVMVSADLARAAIVGAATALVAIRAPAPFVYLLAIAASVLGTAFRPAQAALLPSLARDASELSATNVASSVIESVGFSAGPAVAGLLLALTSQTTVFALDALSFLWSVSFIARLRVPSQPHVERPKRASLLGDSTAGFRTILGDGDLRVIVTLFVAQTIVAGASLVFIVTIALNVLKVGQSGVGFLEAVVGVGGIVGGFVALVRSRRRHLSIDFGIGVMLWAAPLVLVAVSPTLPAAVAMLVLIGLGNSLVDVNAFTVLQRIAPVAVLSRVFGALESVLIAGMAVGALLMPLMIATIGLRAGLAVFGVAVFSLVLLGIRRLHQIGLTTLSPAYLPLIDGNPIFAPLAENVRERLARALVRVTLAPGDVVIRGGEAGDRYYLIESGAAAVTRGGAVVNELGPGDAFGEIALLRDVPRQATVSALSPLTVFALEREVFLGAVTGNDDASRAANAVIIGLLGV